MTTVLQPTMISVVPAGDVERGGQSFDQMNIPVATAVPIRPGFGSFITGANAMMIIPEEELGGITDRQRRLLGVYRLNRLIRLFSIFEIIFIVLFGSIIPLFLILVPFPIMGFLGCKYWNYRFMYCYVSYLAIELVTGVISIYVLRNVMVLVILRAVYTAVNIVVLYFAIRLTSFMLAFEDTDFHFLISSDVIKSLERHHIC